MKCFRHPEADAIGSCKHCAKGVCSQCVRDTGSGLACSESCEQEVKVLRAMVERNRKMYPLAARTHLRNAIWITALATIFLGWGWRGNSGLLIAIGVVFLLGAAFSYMSSRRIEKS